MRPTIDEEPNRDCHEAMHGRTGRHVRLEQDSGYRRGRMGRKVLSKSSSYSAGILCPRSSADDGMTPSTCPLRRLQDGNKGETHRLDATAWMTPGHLASWPECCKEAHTCALLACRQQQGCWLQPLRSKVACTRQRVQIQTWSTACAHGLHLRPCTRMRAPNQLLCNEAIQGWLH